MQRTQGSREAEDPLPKHQVWEDVRLSEGCWVALGMAAQLARGSQNGLLQSAGNCKGKQTTLASGHNWAGKPCSSEAANQGQVVLNIDVISFSVICTSLR